MTTDLSDPERLRLIVAAFIHCKQIPGVREIARQFRKETGRTADADEVERAIRKVSSASA